MQHTKVPASTIRNARLAVAVVGVSLVAGACGATSAIESTADAAPTSVDTIVPTVDETVVPPAGEPTETDATADVETVEVVIEEYVGTTTTTCTAVHSTAPRIHP